MKIWLLLPCFILVHLFGNAQPAELRLLKSINSRESAFKNNLATFSANITHPVAIGVPVAITVAGLLKKDKNQIRNGLFISGTYLVNAAGTQLLKRIIKRKRPYESYPADIIKRADADEGLSFPSGHSSAAFAMATSVSLRYKKWYYVVPTYLLATTVGWARMYQGVHYPGDIIAGAAVGSGTAWLAYKIQQKISKKIPPPNPSTF